MAEVTAPGTSRSRFEQALEQPDVFSGFDIETQAKEAAASIAAPIIVGGTALAARLKDMPEAATGGTGLARELAGQVEQEQTGTPKTRFEQAFDASNVFEERDIGDTAATFARSAAGGLLETAPVVEGALLGARAGALAALPIPIPGARVAGGILGGIAGGVAGIFAGSEARKAAAQIQVPFLGGRVVNPPSEQLPEEERPAAFAGEVVGGSLAPAAVPFRLAKQGVEFGTSFLGKLGNNIIRAARDKPAQVLLLEGTSIGFGAGAEAIAESVAPGETAVRVVSGAGASVFNIPRIVTGAVEFGGQAFSQVMKKLTQSGRETATSRQLIAIIEGAGGDPLVIAEMIERTGLSSIEGLTLAQRTGNEIIASMEADVARLSPAFSAEARKSAEDGIAALSSMILALRGTGDPTLLVEAAKMRQAQFDALLASRISVTQDIAVTAAAKVTQDTPAARSELSRIANEAFGTALRSARNEESKIWAIVDRGLEAGSGNFTRRLKSIQATDLLPEDFEALPAVIQGFAKRMGDSGGVTSSGELILLRSSLLEKSRTLAAAGDLKAARVVGILADAALDDLDIAFKGPNQGALRTLGIDAEAYDTARSFTAALKDTFNATFAGKATLGRNPPPPEVLMKQALSTGQELGNQRFAELKEAVNFLPLRNLGGDEAIQNVDAMIDAQQRFIRLAADQSSDPRTGAVNAKALQKFIKNSEELLNQFPPHLIADLRDAAASQVALKDMENAAKGIARIVSRKAAFETVAGIGNAVEAVSRIVRGQNPTKELDQLARLAKNAGAEEMDGLRATLWDFARSKATGAGGELSIAKFRSALFEPLRPGERSLAEIMRRNGILSPAQIAKTEELFTEIDKISTAMATPAGLENLIDVPGQLMDFLVTIGATKAQAQFSRLVPGPSTPGGGIAAAGRAASAARNVFGKVPAAKMFNVLQEAFRNPEFMTMLLRRTATPEESIKLSLQINSYLWQSGLTALVPDEQEAP